MAQQVALVAKEKKLVDQEREEIAELNHTSAFYSFVSGLHGSPSWAALVSHHSQIQALAALTGMRAFLPMAAVMLASRHFANGPIKFEKEFAWLAEWPTVALLCVLAALEIALDKIRGADEFVDSMMLIVKPAVAWFLAIAPVHPQALSGYQYAVAAALNAELMAIVKMSITAHVSLSTGRSATRSVAEDAAVAVLLVQVIKIPVSAPAVIALSAMLFCAWLVSPYRSRMAKALKR